MSALNSDRPSWGISEHLITKDPDFGAYGFDVEVAKANGAGQMPATLSDIARSL